MFSIHASAPGGLPGRKPVGGPVTGSTKALRVHQCFQQQGTLPRSGLPVVRHRWGAERQNLARQPFDSHPRQDREPSVVDRSIAGCVSGASHSIQSMRLAPASSKPARSRAGRRVPDRRRTARGTPGVMAFHVLAPPTASPLRLPPRPTPAVRILWPRTRRARVRRAAEIDSLAAALAPRRSSSCRHR